MERILRGFVGFSVARHKLVVCLAVLLALIGGLVASRLQVDTGMDSLLPADNPVVQAATEMEQEFGSQDNVLVVVQADAKQAGPFLDALAEKLRTAGLVNSVFYRVQSEVFQQYAPLYLDTALYRSLAAEMADGQSSLSRFLDGPGLQSLVALTAERLRGPTSEQAKQFLEDWARVVIPKEVAPTKEQIDRLLAQLIFGATPSDDALGSGLLSSATGDAHMMVVKPQISLQEFALDRERFFQGLQAALDELTVLHGVSAGFTGGSFVQDYEADSVAMNDFLSTALITFGLIMLLVVIAFRRLAVPLASGLPLVLGTILTSALTVLIYGSINLFSISFAALLLGLGIDFAIHLLARYQEERASGMAVAEALYATLQRTGSGMLIGALTTAVAFACFILAEFSAFAQMGVISAAGVMLAFCSMILVMPAIIAWGDSGRGQRSPKANEFTWLAPVGRFALRRPLVAPLIVLLLTAAVWSAGSGVQIGTNMRELYPADMQSLRWLDVLQTSFEYNPDTVSLVADDLTQLAEWTTALESLPSVAQVESVLDYLPADQSFKLAELEQLGSRLAAGAADLARLGQQLAALPPQVLAQQASLLADDLQRLLAVAAEVEIAPGAQGVTRIQEFAGELRSLEGAKAFTGLVSDLQRRLAETGDLAALKPLTVADLPIDILANYQGKSGRLLLEVSPSGDIWDNATLQRFQSDVAAVTQSPISGMPFLMHEIVSLVKQDVLRVSLIAALVILAMLFAGFRSLKDALLAMLPVAFTLLLTMGLGPWLGLGLNILNLMTLPLIIGIGVDNGVHLTHRLRDSGASALPQVLVHTGKAVAMTTLTTMVGFGSLIFTNHPGLASVGSTIVLGLGICLALTLSLLPSLQALLRTNSSASGQRLAS